MTAFVIEFQLPYRELSSNARVHYRTRAVWTAHYRQDCAVIAREAMRAQQWLPTASQVRMDLLFGIKGGRKIQRYQPTDLSNAVASFKAGQDALVDAGVILGDDKKRLSLGSIEITSKAGPFVRVVLTPV